MNYDVSDVDKAIKSIGGWQQLYADLKCYLTVKVPDLGIVELKDSRLMPLYGEHGYTGEIYIVISIDGHRCFKRSGDYTSFEGNGGTFDEWTMEVKPEPITVIEWEAL